MLESILPADMESEECFGEPPGGVFFPEEQPIMAAAVAARRREYATVRSCARACLEPAGLSAGSDPAGHRRRTHWPAGVRGSMTHCAGYAAAAVGPPPDLRYRHRRRTRRTAP